MANKLKYDVAAIGKQFQIFAEFTGAAVCGNGHINDTFGATYNQAGRLVRYVHQRINQTVFRDPVSLMDNVRRVTEHLRRRLAAQGAADLSRRALTLVPTREGGHYYLDPEGNYWRTYLYLEKVRTFEAVETTEQAFEAGKAFGRFQTLLIDLPGPRLSETIPHFHDTARRFEALERAIEADACNRAQSARAEIEFALGQRPMVSVLLEALRRGELTERITHNDTKFNNVMLDDETREGICVVDLDTVMPGLVHYDFGDMVRTTTSPTKEDERDLARVEMQMPMFEALARGYLSAAGDFLTLAERRHLAFSGRVITFTIGIRFLTDYLCGDTYFKVRRLGHNLERCRSQFKLVESILQQEEKMQNLVDQI